MTKFESLDLLKVGNTIQLAGAIWVGEGKTHLCLFPGEGELPIPVDTLHMTCEEWSKFLRQTDILETEVLATAEDGSITKAILRKSARQISQHISWEVFHRDDFKCRYCGRGPGIPLTVDHLVTWEEQGSSIEENLVASCRKCNKTRGNLSYESWLQHDYYRRVSKNLDHAGHQANVDLLETLDAIPRMIHKPTRR